MKQKPSGKYGIKRTIVATSVLKYHVFLLTQPKTRIQREANTMWYINAPNHSCIYVVVIEGIEN
jgi:hypothetical protein